MEGGGKAAIVSQLLSLGHSAKSIGKFGRFCRRKF
jgi:hypothetical protein